MTDDFRNKLLLLKKLLEDQLVPKIKSQIDITYKSLETLCKLHDNIKSKEHSDG